MLWTAAAVGGEDPRRAATWVRWDSYRYIDVARRGYVEVPGEPSASNTGWFPGYPYLIRVCAAPWHAKPARAGRAVALGFEFALLALVWNRLLPRASASRRWLALFAAAVFPGFVYRHAVFPISMVACFTVAAIAFAAADRFWAAGLSGALAAFSYHSAFLVAVPLGLAALLSDQRRPWARLRACLAGPALALLGLVAVFAFHQAAVGHWDAFLTYQRQDQDIGRRAFNPVLVLAADFRTLFRGSLLRPSTLVSLENALVSSSVLLAALLWWRAGESRRPLDGLLVAYAAAVWLFAGAAGPNVALYRIAAVLVGLVCPLVRLRTPLLAALLAVMVGLGFAIARLFFDNAIV